jgi:hypothetical protein
MSESAVDERAQRDAREPDVAIVCTEVRTVAADAYRLKQHKNDGHAREPRMRLEARMDRLQSDLDRLQLRELHRWLVNLRIELSRPDRP